MALQVMDAAAEAGAEDVVAADGDDETVEGFKVCTFTSLRLKELSMVAVVCY